MSNTIEIAGNPPPSRGHLDDLMLAMDVVDTLRHRDDLVARELDDAGREDALLEKLRSIYRQQGIDVPDHILRDGVKALKDSRFVYKPPGSGLRRALATLYVHRRRHGLRLLALFAALVLGFGAWQFFVVRPERQAADRARIELTQTLPASLAQALRDISTGTTDRDALARAEALKGDAERALRDGDAPAARRAVDDLANLREDLLREYTLTIVSRPGADTGVWRRPPKNPAGRNYYLIVEAIAPDGRKLALAIQNEETGASETVTQFGVRVRQEVFDRVARDKREDGIVQSSRFGVKRRGQLNPDYLMPYEGGMITKW